MLDRMIRAAFDERAQGIRFPVAAFARRACGAQGFAWIFLE